MLRIEFHFWLSLMLVLASCGGPLQVAERTVPPEPRPDVAGELVVDFVDPFIGSDDGRWSFFTPASAPFGMVKVAPDTSGFGGYGGGGHTTGYSYSHDSIIGFSHLHAHALGGFLFMPTVGELRTIPGDSSATDGFRSKFRKETEKAGAGYYSVILDKYNIKAEMTATPRVGFHRYTFPQTGQAHILVDVGHVLGEAGLFGQPVEDAWVSVVDDRSISASVCFTPWFSLGPVTVYLRAEFSKPFRSFGMYRDASQFDGATHIEGPGVGFYADFETREGEAIEVKAAVSFVSPEQAEINMRMEAAGKGFDEVLSETRLEWNKWLSRIEVVGDDLAMKRKFYTALWHVLLGRGISEDADGRYVRASGEVGQIPLFNGKPAFHRYNTDGLWGSFSNLNQLWSLVYPEVMSSYARFLLSAYEDYGWIPDGFVVNQVAPGMPINHTTAFIAAAILGGVGDLDPDEAFAAVAKTQNIIEGRPRWVGNEVLEPYLLFGYAGYEYPAYGPTSQNLEYSYQDFCAGQLALRLGKTTEANEFLARAKNYRNIFDPETKMFRPRSTGGDFLTDFDPLNGFGFTEGNAWQFLWYVPHDIPGLIELMGQDLFLNRLSEILQDAEAYGFGGNSGNVSGYSLRYNHGNQVNLHASWLFNLAGRPDLTQYYTRRIAEIFYGTTPARGYGGGQDEDEGLLGSWFVLASIGLFDVQGGCSLDPQFQLSIPLFDEVVIHLSGDYYSGEKFVIKKVSTGTDRGVIDSILLNERPLTGFAIPRRLVVNGGELVIHVE